ncbi:MAG: helix-turn-helix domain-containing protein [Nitrospirae bacterium]|nr:helix-turn-helix domain-containing protein [Nitrospirota bacterium]
MKPLLEQNFYEVFEISTGATRAQIDQAYELAKKTYGDNSLAAYSLFDSEERKEIIRKIHLAYETLSDENRRSQYDRDLLGLAAPEKPASSVSESVKTAPVVAAPALPKSTGETMESVEIESLTGLDLRQIRERLGIPLQEIANKTRINITYFQFLEKNQFRSLPPSVYLRSYVIQYARLLGLDGDRVADRILWLVEQSRKPDPI